MPAVVAFPRLRSVLFDLLVAGGVAGLTGLGIFMRETPHSTMALGYVMAAATLVRRRWPLTVMGVVAAAALLQVILYPARYNDPLPYDLAVLVAMYSTVKYGRRMLDAWLAAAVVATGVVIEVVRHFGPNWWALALWYLGVCGGVWLMAYTIRTRRLYVAGLEERAATLEREREHLARIAVADERATIARELHDVVAHSLAVMIVQADGGWYAFETSPGQAREALATVAATGREALEDMRRLVGVLRGSGTGADEPAPDRRRVTLEQLDTLVERARSAGLTVVVHLAGPPPPVAPAVELAVYRIVQEALTNVLRHAGRHAKVELTVVFHPDAVELSIVDDGGGRPADTGVEAGQGNGLVGMRERVAVHDGRFHAGPTPDGGWSVEVTIPLGEAERAADGAAPAGAGGGA